MIEEASKLFEAGDFKNAATQFEKLLENKVINPLVNLNLGRCYYELNKPKRALPRFDEALELFNKLGNKEYKVKTLVLASECHKKLGDL